MRAKQYCGDCLNCITIRRWEAMYQEALLQYPQLLDFVNKMRKMDRETLICLRCNPPEPTRKGKTTSYFPQKMNLPLSEEESTATMEDFAYHNE